VKVPISPSISRRRVFSSGGLGAVFVVMVAPCLHWPAGQEPNLVPVVEKQKDTNPAVDERAAGLDAQRKELPDQPGVYVFKDEDGGVLYVGKALSVRKRVASHFSGPHRRGRPFIDQVASIDF